MRTVLFSILAVLGVSSIHAKSADSPGRAIEGQYILRFSAPPVSQFDGEQAKDGRWILQPTRPGKTRFQVSAKAVVDYRENLREQRERLLNQAGLLLGRELAVRGTTDLTSHIAVVQISDAEARKLAAMDGIRAVEQDRRAVRHTDTGPGWIQAPAVWAGIPGVPATQGEGVVIGILDGGINPTHPAFSDPSPDGYDHVNPLGAQFGTCSLAQVQCNDKLIGVYDFTNDAGQIGIDTDGHGTHVASVAAGNQRTTLVGITATEEISLSGVAPRANIISYKVCRPDDPDTEPDEDGCPISGILQAVDQAVNDGVQLINLSLGSTSTDPWIASMARELLDARALGLLTVTSAGNLGPDDGTVGTPADAPWTLSVANTTHSRLFQNSAINLAGGNAPPPDDLLGVGLTGAFGPAPIVHARDFGNALCGAGEPELQSNCDDHTGSSNPFAPNTFNGEIVVCDRGTYGRVEKGFNLRAAGAGGYILANTDAQGESIVGDDHCLPAVHLGAANGDLLREWLEAGGEPTGEISGLTRVEVDAAGDILSISSSRGPNASVIDLLKPEIAAPGSNILGASHIGSESAFLSGTSFSSPHVAGAAALIKSAYPGYSASDIHSILVSSAVNDGMRDSDGVTPASSFGVGAGRARPDLAVRAGLAFAVTAQQFLAADPASGGSPRDLNLPTLQDNACLGQCTFVRTVTDKLGGGMWQASAIGPDGLIVEVAPSMFELGAGESQTLTITVNVSDIPELVGQWVHGAVLLAPADSTVSTTRMPFAVNSLTGEVPDRIVIDNAGARGQQTVTFDDIVALPDAEYLTAGLNRAEVLQRSLVQDPTRNDPYDGFGEGTFFHLLELDAGGGAVIAQTLPQNNGDLDLFVGFDANGNGLPDEAEELCSSTSSTSTEECVVGNVADGTYWILLQNWASANTGSSDVSRLRVVGVENQTTSLVATGPGDVPANTPFSVRLHWNAGLMRPGETWFGTLTPKTSREPGAGILGVVPVQITVGTPSSVDPGTLDRIPAYAFTPNDAARFELAAGEGHGRLFVDVPAGARSLTVSATSGRLLDLHVVRQAFAFSADTAPPAADLADPLESSTGATSHEIVINDPEPGRYHLVPVNTASESGSVRVEVLVDGGEVSVQPRPGLFFNPQRNGHGFNLNQSADGQLIIEWYTYLEDGTPTWYLAQAPRGIGNQWFAELLHFRWNGSEATATPVGVVVLTFEDPDTLAMSFRVNGESGTERHTSIGPVVDCAAGPDQTGLWFVPGEAGYGYSVQSGQVQINYLYDGFGAPRWVLGQTENILDGAIDLGQFTGFCPTCSAVATTMEIVGTNEFVFDGSGGQIMTDVLFVNSVPGQWIAGGALQNLTPLCSEDVR